MNRQFICQRVGKATLTTVMCLLFVGSSVAQRKEVDYSRIKAPQGTNKYRPMMAFPVDSTRKTKPSVLTIKAFAVDISKPLPSAVAMITSKTTGKTQQFSVPNGRLDCVFNGADVLSIEVSAEGYKTVKRTLVIAVSPYGNHYEFDAELDQNPIGLTVWAVDHRTGKTILDARFTISNKAGSASMSLTTDATTGLSKIDLPGKGIYLLSSTANGYSDFMSAIVLDSAQNEARFILAAKEVHAETKPPIKTVVASSAPGAKAPIKPTGVALGSVTTPVVVPPSPLLVKPAGLFPTGKPIQLNAVYFDQSSPVLRPQSYPELDQLYALLLENPSVQIEIRGHTDNQGDFDLNLKLSRDRCQAIIDYLVSKGIAKNRLRAVGRGPIDPVAPNNNEENRRKNRRVEFVVI